MSKPIALFLRIGLVYLISMGKLGELSKLLEYSSNMLENTSQLIWNIPVTYWKLPVGSKMFLVFFGMLMTF